jgi:hypothetical protein
MKQTEGKLTKMSSYGFRSLLNLNSGSGLTGNTLVPAIEQIFIIIGIRQLVLSMYVWPSCQIHMEFANQK